MIISNNYKCVDLYMLLMLVLWKLGLSLRGADVGAVEFGTEFNGC